MKYLTIITAALMCSGCATTSSVRRADRDAQEAKELAQQALDVATQSRAQSQKTEELSLRTEEMVNRGFKKSMYK